MMDSKSQYTHKPTMDELKKIKTLLEPSMGSILKRITTKEGCLSLDKFDKILTQVEKNNQIRHNW